MTLVERFIDFTGWPNSRKTVLIALLSAPTTLVGGLVYYASQSAAPGVTLRPEIMAPFYLTWGLAQLLSLVVALPAARAGRDMRGSAHLYVFLNSLFSVGLMYLCGTMSSPFVSTFPAAVILWALFFDARIAGFGIVCMVCALLATHLLETADMLPYAPALVDRALDAQQGTPWFAMVLLMTLMLLGFCFFLVVLILEARKLQDRRLLRVQTLIRRYVPSQVADRIIAGEQEATGRHERRRLTIFFSDLVGFTDLSEELEPEDLSRLLNEYFSAMTAIAHKHGGTVDELSGDAILIFFGAPSATNDKDHALRAVRMALEMQQAISGLNAKWRAAGITETLQARMGINTGLVTVGDFGSPDRMKYAALGKHVNLAARVQAQCEPGKVLISHATWLLASDQVQAAPKAAMQFKGISKPVMTYEVMAQE